MTGICVFSPERSAQLITEAVVNLPETQNAFQNGYLVIANGTMNSNIAKALTKEDYPQKEYTVGIIENHCLGVTPQKERIKPLLLFKGRAIEKDYLDILPEMGHGDVIIKGANAVDPHGTAGILVAGEMGGTIGRIYGQVIARSIELIIPVSLRKLIPSVKAACDRLKGIDIEFSDGIKASLFPVISADIITEKQAAKFLFNVDLELIASGGFGDSISDLVFFVEGSSNSIKALESFRR
ncbi:hypothetical protein JXA84_06995 [candidate division WOR-3 bacterium]|nr:hypothetical protein [candidate division WOR-3 bacterium]